MPNLCFNNLDRPRSYRPIQAVLSSLKKSLPVLIGGIARQGVGGYLVLVLTGFGIAFGWFGRAVSFWISGCDIYR